MKKMIVSILAVVVVMAASMSFNISDDNTHVPGIEKSKIRTEPKKS